MVQDIIDGITGFFSNIGSGLVDLLLSLISNIINLVLIPVDSLFSTFLPDLSLLIINFSDVLGVFISAPFSFFYNLFPPVCKSLLLLWLFILLSYYTIIWTYRGIILVTKVINKIKFW